MAIIGKNKPLGTSYLMPEANEQFAKSEEVEGVRGAVTELDEAVDGLSEQVLEVAESVEKLGGTVDGLSDTVDTLGGTVGDLSDSVDDLEALIPTPTSADDGKVLTANDSGGYELETPSGGTIVPTPTTADDGKVLTANDSGGYELEELPNINTKLDRQDARGEGYIAFNPATGSTIGPNSVNLGTGNKTTSNGGVAIGSDNAISGAGNKAFGSNNTLPLVSNDCYAIGFKNSLSRVNYCYAFGRNLIVDGSWTNEANLRLLLGSFNAIPLLPNCFMVIGGGTSSNNTKNLFEMDSDGNAVFLGTVNGIPHAPTTDGTYKLQCIVTNGTPTFSWVADV